MAKQSLPRNSNPGYDLLLALCSAVFGVFLGSTIPALVTKIFGSSPAWYDTVAYYGIIVLIFACLVWIGSKLISLARSIHESRNEFRSGIEEVQKEVQDRVGITVTYYDNPEAVFQKAKEVVLAAKRKILVLNSFITEEDEPGDHSERDAYYAALMRLATKGVEYHRITQFSEKQILRIEARQPVEELKRSIGYSNHFRTILATQSQHPQLRANLSLHWVPAQRLTTFVLVDDVNLIWQVNKLPDPGQTERMRMQGAFIIYDPKRVITQHFDQFFRELMGSAAPMNDSMIPA